jgi:hypothetical protein
MIRPTDKLLTEREPHASYSIQEAQAAAKKSADLTSHDVSPVQLEEAMMISIEAGGKNIRKSAAHHLQRKTPIRYSPRSPPSPTVHAGGGGGGGNDSFDGILQLLDKGLKLNKDGTLNDQGEFHLEFDSAVEIYGTKISNTTLGDDNKIDVIEGIPDVVTQYIVYKNTSDTSNLIESQLVENNHQHSVQIAVLPGANTCAKFDPETKEYMPCDYSCQQENQCQAICQGK